MTLYGTYFRAALIPLLRTPAYWAPLVIFPSLLFSFFGLGPARQSPEIANFLLASWSVFAVIGIGFFQFGIGIAQARESKWEDYARTLPAGGAPRLVAQLLSAGVFAAVSLGLLWTLVLFTAPVSLSPLQYARLLGVLLGGLIPFVMIGAALGYTVPSRGAVPIANLLYLPLSYLGGLWIPPQMLPGIVERISPYTPTRQLGELAWATVQDQPLPEGPLLGLAMYAAGAGAWALVMWRRDETLKTK
jgi:ABC-2 type transport system permease protein